MKYSKQDYRFVRFEVSERKNKKYDAILRNIHNNKFVRVPFGDNRYQQYKDDTGLNAYSYLDHNDLLRRRLYLLRHSKDLDPDNFTPGNFAIIFLW